MKITEVLKSDKVTLSMEVFPPKTTTAAEKVNEAVRDIAALKPHFIERYVSVQPVAVPASIRSRSPRISRMPTVLILWRIQTCLSSTKETVEKQITLMKEAGIENILALRGDIPKETEFPLPGQFHYAAELVREIKCIAPEMCIGGACYPEGHPEANSKAMDILHIKEKVDAGCEFLTTQMSFDNSIFYNYLYRLREAGVMVPIIAGIMPITQEESGCTKHPAFRQLCAGTF